MAVTEAPVVVTERLELWRPARRDLEEMYAIVSHPETARHLGPRDGIVDQFQRLCRNAGSWFLYGYGGLTLRPRGSNAIVGTAGVFHSWRGLGGDFDDKPEAGWILRHDQVGKGLAREAMDAALAWFEREHGPQTVVCMIAPGNEPSLRLASALEFAELREAVLPDGECVKLFARPPGGRATVGLPNRR